MKLFNLKLLTFIFILLCSCAGKKLVPETVKDSAYQSPETRNILPLDSNVVKGRLDNGLFYYIRENHKPEKRIELRLAVKAGSVLEESDQQGLAHFTEHMAFNGTKNFRKQELIDYLESIGMRVGPGINAYTGLDETVYMLQVPADSIHIVEKAFQILEDWTHKIEFEEDEIDKERGVVIEEWRLGRGADARMRDKQLPILFKGARYADRLPIGKVEIIDDFTRETLLRFYRDWYRPDLMAIIAVGDFDSEWIEKQIRKYFSRLSSPHNPREREIYPMPDHKETLFAIATDPEATGSSVSIYYKHDVKPEITEDDYRRRLVAALYNGMLNQRFHELTKEAEPPFLYGFSAKGRFVLSKEVYMLSAGVRDNGIERGLKTIITEAARVEKFGFTASELDRQKREILRFMEKAFDERDKTESRNYANEYLRNFTMDEPIPGIEYEYGMYRKYIPGITLEEVNRLADEWITDENRVIMVNAPEKPGVTVPDEKELLTIINSVGEKDIEPYVDTVTDEPLVDTPPGPSPVVNEHTISGIGVTEWTLANGVRVILKPTDFKNDEIRFTSFSPGGSSLTADENYIPASTAASVIREGGAGRFNVIELDKMLAGKVVSVSPWIGSLREGISGSASPKDVETMFQLIYLYITAPRKDTEAFQSFKSRMKGFIENRHARPETVFQDTLMVTMAQYHNRARPWTTELLDEMNINTSFEVYSDRFRDAGDFTFFFVGNFTPVEIKPLVETYLGGLPTQNRKETWKDVGIDYPEGVITKEVKKGLEPKSRVSIVFTGPFSWSRKSRYELGSMIDVLRIKLRETLREDMGGTYGVGISRSTSHYPDEEYQIRVSFGSAPERVEELTKAVFTLIDSLKTFETTELYLTKVKEAQRRKREVDLKENTFWLNVLESYYYHGEDPMEILEYDKLVDSLTLDNIRETAQKYFNMDNYVKVVLYPED